jgi:thiosulfate dehydrogenase [quinone] large subunit
MSIEGPTILPPNDHDKLTAYALLRVTLGTNIAMHGLSRIIAGPAVFSSKLTTQFVASPLPQPLVHAFGQGLPWVEGLFGLLLLIGLRTRAALIGGALLMLVLTFGSSLIQDWQAASTQLLYAAVYTALLFLLRFNGWSIDALLERKKWPAI